MPAFGPTHDHKMLWSIVSFIPFLPKLSPEQYTGMIKKMADRMVHQVLHVSAILYRTEPDQ